MGIEVICTPYGPAATERLGEQIAALKGGDTLAPVTVVVPTNIAGLGVRRALGGKGQGIAAVNFLKLFDLAERLAGRDMAVMHGRKPVSGSVISATVRRVLNSEPGLFEASASHPATEQALVRSYRDLRDLSDDQLSVLARQSERAADVVRICGQIRDLLKEKWYDRQDLNDLAIKAMGSDSTKDIIEGFGPVIIHLPQRVTRSQGRLVSALALATPVEAIIGLTGDHTADSAVLESVRCMGAELEASPKVVQPHAQRIISTASADEEVRVAVREVINAARDGIPLSRVAVLCGGGMPVIRQLHDHLEAADIPYNGPSGRTLGDSLVGRGLLALLNLESRDFRRDEVFALLSVASATVSGSEAGNNSPLLATDLVMAWERVSRRAGVARGSGQWTERLERHAVNLRSEAEDKLDDRDQNAYRIERLHRDADYADSLAHFMTRLIADLRPDPAPTTWKGWGEWVEGLIHTYLGDERARHVWPEPEQESAEQIELILDRLANLDEIDRNPRPATFRHTLISELGTATRRKGRVGHGVFADQVGAAPGLEFDRIILIGMAEGTFPHSPLDDPLLPDRERKALGDDLTLMSDRMAEQHRNLLTALASTEISTLVYSRGDSRRASEQHASRWLLDSATQLAGRLVDSTNLENLADDEAATWFEHVPSLAGRVLHAEFPATDQEFHLQALAQTAESDDRPVGDAVLSRGADLVQSRASEKFTRFDGNLADVDIAGLMDEVVSPTSLETWADCPMRYLFRHVLRVLPVDQPEELLEISPLEKGSLVHNALDRFMQEQLDEGQVPLPGKKWSESQRDRLQEIGRQLCQEAEDQGLTGAPVYWHHHRSRILSDLDRFLDEDNEQRREFGATPTASELAFGMSDGDLGPISVPLSDGRELKFRGRADRIDQGTGDSFFVTDYKTGKAEKFKGLDENSKDWDPVQRGTKLQLPVYGLAARAHGDNPEAPVRSQYWFVTSDQQFKTYGYELDDEVMDRFGTVVGTITAGIEAGVFCDRPQPDQTEGRFSQRCEYCNPDRLGTQDRRRAWELKRDQEDLADYRNLAEPPAENPDLEAD